MASMCTTTLIQEGLCALFPMETSQGVSGQLNGRKDRCAVNHVSLGEHGMHFLPRIPIQLTGNPLGSEIGVYSGVNVNVTHIVISFDSVLIIQPEGRIANVGEQEVI
ncbi:hypothetical protein AVEN_26790-1 [Araneus ventricosus]|uniref:Uncharacterized protein n=1 Tax=Araneus ventricosus TaxID=182803 RepID=A0A4Y2D7B8_ARAVE|nr:hypothetical protein AVEN_26790-1 [Araneus ventricosus]